MGKRTFNKNFQASMDHRKAGWGWGVGGFEGRKTEMVRSMWYVAQHTRALTDAHTSGEGPCSLSGVLGQFCLAVIENMPLLAKAWVQPKLETHTLKKNI